MKTFIYILIDPITNLVRYVGKSDNPKKRLAVHSCRTEKNYKHSWIVSLKNKHLKPIIEIIDEVPIEEWRFWEKHYISLFKSWGYNLTNLTEGGEGFASGILNPSHLPHVKLICSKTHKNKILSKETKEKIRESLKGRKNIEHSKRMLGRKDSEETRLKKSTSMMGKNSVLKEDDVIKIKKLLKNNINNLTIKEISLIFGVNRSVIKNIKRGKTWKHITI